MAITVRYGCSCSRQRVLGGNVVILVIQDCPRDRRGGDRRVLFYDHHRYGRPGRGERTDHWRALLTTRVAVLRNALPARPAAERGPAGARRNYREAVKATLQSRFMQRGMVAKYL